MSKRQLKCIHEIMCALNKGHRLRIYKVEKTRFWTSKYRDKRKRREKIDLNQHIFFLAETQKMLFAVRVGVSKKRSKKKETNEREIERKSRLLVLRLIHVIWVT